MAALLHNVVLVAHDGDEQVEHDDIDEELEDREEEGHRVLVARALELLEVERAEHEREAREERRVPRAVSIDVILDRLVVPGRVDDVGQVDNACASAVEHEEREREAREYD